MRKIKALLVLLLGVVLISTLAPVQASEITTTEPPTTEATTEPPTTEEPATTAETTEEEPLEIIIGEDSITIGDVELSRDELEILLASALEQYADPLLKTFGWSAAALATAIVGVGLWLISKLVKNTIEQRNNRLAYSTTHEATKATNQNINSQTSQLKSLDARLAKSEAMNALLVQGMTTLMAKSSNQSIAESSASFKAEAERVLAIKDDISDVKQIIETAGKTVAKAIVGETVQKIKDKRAKLLADLNGAPTDPNTPSNQG